MRVLLDNQGVFPAFILGRYWDIIAWNRSASLLLGGLESLPIEQRNHVWLMFGSPMIRQSLIDWDVHAHRMIAEFRVSCGHYLDDPKFADLIAPAHDHRGRVPRRVGTARRSRPSEYL